MAKLDLSLTREELERYLAFQPTVRVATVGPSGIPHVVPLWFVWVHRTLYLNSTLGNPTVENMLRTGQACAVVDDGTSYDELRGVVLTGIVERADGDPNLPEVDRLWSDKYMGGNPTPYGRWKDRVWLRLIPERVASWDFRKIPEAKARREAKEAGG
jgi:nitroimidazol reductase NimA-like FMN-containing flavoprotein (pyridoxamine 5'-phosphate oxidase superfamily)